MELVLGLLQSLVRLQGFISRHFMCAGVPLRPMGLAAVAHFAQFSKTGAGWEPICRPQRVVRPRGVRPNRGQVFVSGRANAQAEAAGLRVQLAGPAQNDPRERQAAGGALEHETGRGDSAAIRALPRGLAAN